MLQEITANLELPPAPPATHDDDGQPPLRATRGLLARGFMKIWKPRAPIVIPPDHPPASSHPTPRADALVDRVLAARGISSHDDRIEFLTPRLTRLHDPSTIPDLDRAAERLLAAARAAEPIVIYGDYDVDGVTATAILFHTLKALAPDCRLRTYVPHRLEEGYGLNSDAIRQLALGDEHFPPARVIVSVDCGVTAVEPARIAREMGVDLLITDHHNPPARLVDMPDAFAVVHPRRPDSSYPFGELSGAGVAYKLAWRLATLDSGSAKAAPHARELLIELLALASLGTIADVVPLVGENRVIARHGLARIKNSSIIGLRALVEASGLAGEDVDAEGVGFKLGPRLNACGRLGHAREAVELFTTAPPDRAAEIARQLTSLNNERRKVERAIFEQACELAESAGMTRPDRRAIVLACEGWHAGVVGIVCSRLVERFGRPAILLGRDADMCHGSGRSIDGFSLHEGLTRCAKHLHTFGGHDMAAGLRLRNEQLEHFTDAFTAVANDAIHPDDLCGTIDYDCDAALDELTPRTVRDLERLGPFGRGNPTVRLRLADLTLTDPPKLLGSTGKHLALRAKDHRGRYVRLVAWNWGDRVDRLRRGHVIDAIVTPRVSTYAGESVEPVIEDVRVMPG